MFWGLIMEPNKRYSQLVERSFHLSMASLDVTSANDQPVQVMLCYDNRNYLLCTLKKGSIFQVPLDLNFQEGTKIAFTCNGFGHVHLTGYLTLDEDLDFGDLEEEEEEEEEEIPQLVKQKRKATESPKKASKKAKKEAKKDEDSSDDDDELDLDAESDSENGEPNLMNDEDESDEDSENEDSEDEDSDDEDDDSDDEPEPEVTQPKQKQKQNQQAQNQVGKKQEKQKMVNGKEAQEDLNKQKKNKAEQQQQNSQQQGKKRNTIEGGVQFEDLKVGNGAPAKPGKNVTVYYLGKLKNGKKFDETRQGEGFKFQLGKGEVIKGWDVGIAGMKVGGKRRLTIPAAMGYGQKGSPPVIPSNATLIFDVELRNVH